METVIVKVGARQTVRRLLSDRQIAKREEATVLAAADRTAEALRLQRLAALSAVEDAAVLADRPDAVLLCRLAVARRLLDAGRPVPDALLRATGI